MRRAALLASGLLLLLAACRSARPPAGEAIAPLTSTSPSEAAAQLARRRADFSGVRSLVRIRIPNSMSARAALEVDRQKAVTLTVFTPVGTTAARLHAAHDRISFEDDVHGTKWEGKASDFAGSYGIFGSTLPTESIAELLVGLPPATLGSVTYAATGMQQATFGDVVVTYEPPVYPPRRVLIDRGERHVEIDYLGGQVAEPRSSTEKTP
jgi:outer membrane biogenesis lipoprotein LolB